MYGINTGFGKLAQTRIPAERLDRTATKPVLSHSVGYGKTSGRITLFARVMATKILSLSRGHSGIRIEVIDALDNVI